MSKDVSWAHVVRQISNLDIALYVYTVYNEWMSVCLGEPRFFLSRLVRTTWMGYKPMSLLLFFGPLFEFTIISLGVSAFADAHKQKHIRDVKSL